VSQQRQVILAAAAALGQGASLAASWVTGVGDRTFAVAAVAAIALTLGVLPAHVQLQKKA
jgi:hypothetical protein